MADSGRRAFLFRFKEAWDVSDSPGVGDRRGEESGALVADDNPGGPISVKYKMSAICTYAALSPPLYYINSLL